MSSNLTIYKPGDTTHQNQPPGDLNAVTEAAFHSAVVALEVGRMKFLERGGPIFTEYWSLLLEPELRAQVADHHLELARLGHQFAGGIHESEVARLQFETHRRRLARRE